MDIPESTGMDGIGIGNPERREGREKKQERKDKEKNPNLNVIDILFYTSQERGDRLRSRVTLLSHHVPWLFRCRAGVCSLQPSRGGEPSRSFCSSEIRQFALAFWEVTLQQQEQSVPERACGSSGFRENTCHRSASNKERS